MLNHKAGADFTEPFMATEVAENDRNKEISGLYEIEGWTGFNFPGRKGKYSQLEWHHQHFTYVLDRISLFPLFFRKSNYHYRSPAPPGPFARCSDSSYRSGVDWDARGQKKSIFKIQGEGKTWAKAVDKEKGSFDYLMFSDIDHSHPEAANDIKAWGEWIIRETGASGFRLSALALLNPPSPTND